MGVAIEPVWAVTPEKVDAVVRRLIEAGRPRKIFLFGSYVRGQTHRDSDLDVLVVTDDKVENTRKESARLRSAVSDIHMPMDILVIPISEYERLRDRWDLIYYEATQNGRVVYDRPATFH